MKELKLLIFEITESNINRVHILGDKNISSHKLNLQINEQFTGKFVSDVLYRKNLRKLCICPFIFA